MNNKKAKYIIIFLFVSQLVFAQNKVHFYNDNFRKAVAIAKIEGKSVFVDTWATWCIPCKKQEKVFHDPRVIRYLNKNFINLRINMDSEHGKKMNLEYEVVFLPTLLVLDEEGEVRDKTENYMGANELLSFLKYSKDKKAQKYSTGLNNEPFVNTGADEVYVTTPVIRTHPKKTTNPSQSESKTKSQNTDTLQKSKDPETSNVLPPENVVTKETIVKQKAPIPEKSIDKSDYIFVDESTNIEDLAAYHYNKTELSLQNGNSNYKENFRKYLETQRDWSTDKNIRFIYNYVNTTKSEAFHYMIKNRDAFENIVGPENYEKSIQFLIYNRLYQGYPRATWEDANRLYGYLYPKNDAKTYANQYFMQRLFVDKQFKEFTEFAINVLDEQKNSGIMLSLAEVYLKELDKPKKALKWIEKAIEIDASNHKLYYTKAKALLARGKNKKALKAIKKAKEIADKQEKEFPEWEELMHQINGAD